MRQIRSFFSISVHGTGRGRFLAGRREMSDHSNKTTESVVLPSLYCYEMHVMFYEDRDGQER